MKISVITVCHNAARTVEDTLLSVQQQTHADIEHILIDGASGDGTREIIARHKSCLAFWVSEPDRGVYDAMNKGLAAATGEIVGFLNGDDVYADNNVLRDVAAVFDNTSLDSCYSDLVYVDPGDLNKVVRYWQSEDYHEGFFGKGWCPPHPTFFVRKKIYDRFGGFDLDFALGNDVEIMMRFLAKHKISTAYIPRILVKMRIGGISNRNIRNIIRQNLEIFAAARKNGIAINPFLFIFSKFLSRAQQFRSKPSGRK
jgi:glycosyltransferase involved in cell wall biosynthesis